MNNIKLGDRMKLYESAVDIRLNPCMYYMIRLDGKNFSKMVKRWPLIKPFDVKFNIAMIHAAKSLFELIPNISLIWTGSDEISCLFTFPDIGSPYYDGRIQKIISLASAQVTVNFNDKLREICECNTCLGIFDARIMQFPNEIEAYNCFIFRQRDCVRNSISGYAQSKFSHTQLLKKNSEELKAMLVNAGYNWETDAPAWSKYGTTLKKVKYTVTSADGKEQYVRTNIKENHAEQLYDIVSINTYINNNTEVVTEAEWENIKYNQ